MAESGGRPRILITRAEDVPGERWEDYADRVREAGGDPTPLDLGEWLESRALPACDALLVTAGVDVDPHRYGEEPSARVTEVNAQRDEFEESVIAAALERDIPLLAICRGQQIFNVGRGGALLQHLEQREPHRARRGEGDAIDSGWHDVAVMPGSLLARVLGATSVRVNSRHHQAVTPDRLAPGLLVCGLTTEGETVVVEALEDPTRRWALAVQWHPEMAEMEDGGRLFRALVEACRTAE